MVKNTTFVALAVSQIRKHRKLVEFLAKAAHKVSPETVALLEYPVYSRRRWDEENPHQALYSIIDQQRSHYEADLRSFLLLSEYLLSIPARRTSAAAPTEPCWINGWIPALDGVALYSYIAIHKPRVYMEIGSGNSTKFARRAIVDQNLDTRIVSIDPFPRAEVDEICDEIIRSPVEEVDLEVFDRLGTNDVLYVDNSHTVFMNSDATAVFLDVLPRLKPGVLIEFHDIMLPYDYPAEWIRRHYSEQYVLAAYMLASGAAFDIVLPNMFISHDDELKRVLLPLWERDEMKDVARHGCSFWVRKR